MQYEKRIGRKRASVSGQLVEGKLKTRSNTFLYLRISGSNSLFSPQPRVDLFLAFCQGTSLTMSRQKKPSEDDGERLFPPMLWDKFMTHFYAIDEIMDAFRDVVDYYPDESRKSM